MSELYQIGLPVECLSTVIMLWDSYERPCKLLINPANTEGWAVIELRNTLLASEVTKTIPQSRVKILDIPVKQVKI